MSTSGSGQIPPQNTVSAPKTNRGGGSDVVKIIRLPDALQNNARALRVEGTVTQINNNGSARIQTERGAIDVQLPNNSSNNRAEVGQRLEVNIPAGKPPRQASIRADGPSITRPDNAGQNTSLNTQANTQVNNAAVRRDLPNTAAPQTASGANTNQTAGQTTARIPNAAPNTPLPQGALPGAAQTSANAPLPQAPLPVGATVRLVSVTPSQANQITQQFLSLVSVQPAAITSASFTANIIAQNAVNALGKAAINIGTPQVYQAPLNQNISLNINSQTLSASLTNTAQATVPNNNFINGALNQASPQITISAPNSSVNNAALSGALQNNLTISNAGTSSLVSNPLANAVNASLIPQSGNSIIGKIDVQILQISQPNISLTAPTISSGQSTQTPTNTPALTQITPPIISQNSAATITGQVTGFTPQGQPLLTLQLPGAPLPQSFILQYTPNNIALGSQIKINVSNISLIQAGAATAQPSPALNSMLQGFQWGAFDEMIQAFIQQSPQAAQSLIRTLPNAANPAQLGAAGLAIMAAVRGGDLSTWLGDKKIETLQRLTRASITSSLTQDSAAPRAESASNSDWRAVPLPMFWEGEIHKITLFMRQEGQEQNQRNDSEGSTRFIFDLDMSRMGEIQLDGLLRQDRLDLVVRAQNAFSAPMQQIMKAAYSNAINQTQMGGELSFQGQNNWVDVIKAEESKLGVSI